MSDLKQLFEFKNGKFRDGMFASPSVCNAYKVLLDGDHVADSNGTFGQKNNAWDEVGNDLLEIFFLQIIMPRNVYMNAQRVILY